MTPHVHALVKNADDQQHTTSLPIDDPMGAGCVTHVAFANVIDRPAASRASRKAIND